MFYNIRVLKNFPTLTEKHLCWGLLLINFQAFRPAIFLSRDPKAGAFLWILQNSLQHHFLQIISSGCFQKVKGKRLEYTYHRQIFKEIYSVFLLTSPRDMYALWNLTEAQQLRVFVWILNYSLLGHKSNSLHNSRWGRTLLWMWLQLHYQCNHAT